MAGIPGQPTPKPSNVKSPVPGNDPFAELDAIDPSAYAELDALDAGTQTQSSQGEHPIAEAIAEYAPAVGGFIGGVGGAVAGIPTLGLASGPAAVVGTGLGAAAGQSLRRLIEINMLNKGTDSTVGQELKDVGIEGGKEAAYQAIGGGVAKVGGKVASKLASTPAGKAAIEAAGKAVEAPANYIKGLVSKEYDELVKPVLSFIAEKGTPLTPEKSGDTIKSFLKNKLSGQYKGFQEAYDTLDTVAQSVPIKDELRLKFGNSLKESAVDLSRDEYKLVSDFAENLLKSDNGAKFSSEVRRLNGAIRSLNQAGETELATTLRGARDKATEFYENETLKMASRLSQGKGTETEMGFLKQIAQQRGLPENEVQKYAKTLSQDYIKSIHKVRQDYGVFRDFLEDVGEQVKIRPTKIGPTAFLDKLDDVPSEKLVEKMFDPKNARALRKMQGDTPEVFDQVVRAKVNNLVQKSSTGGSLDLVKFREQVNAMPPDTRNILFGSKQVKDLNKIMDNPRLERIQKLSKEGESMLANWAGKFAEATRIGAKETARIAKKPAIAVPVKRQVGKGLVDVFGGQPAEE